MTTSVSSAQAVVGPFLIGWFIGEQGVRAPTGPAWGMLGFLFAWFVAKGLPSPRFSGVVRVPSARDGPGRRPRGSEGAASPARTRRP